MDRQDKLHKINDDNFKYGYMIEGLWMTMPRLASQFGDACGATRPPECAGLLSTAKETRSQSTPSTSLFSLVSASFPLSGSHRRLCLLEALHLFLENFDISDDFLHASRVFLAMNVLLSAHRGLPFHRPAL